MFGNQMAYDCCDLMCDCVKASPGGPRLPKEKNGNHGWVLASRAAVRIESYTQAKDKTIVL